MPHAPLSRVQALGQPSTAGWGEGDGLGRAGAPQQACQEAPAFVPLSPPVFWSPGNADFPSWPVKLLPQKPRRKAQRQHRKGSLYQQAITFTHGQRPPPAGGGAEEGRTGHTPPPPSPEGADPQYPPLSAEGSRTPGGWRHADLGAEQHTGPENPPSPERFPLPMSRGPHTLLSLLLRDGGFLR